MPLPPFVRKLASVLFMSKCVTFHRKVSIDFGPPHIAQKRDTCRPFSILQNSNTRKTSGFGLGRYQIRQILAQLGPLIWRISYCLSCVLTLAALAILFVIAACGALAISCLYMNRYNEKQLHLAHNSYQVKKQSSSGSKISSDFHPWSRIQKQVTPTLSNKPDFYVDVHHRPSETMQLTTRSKWSASTQNITESSMSTQLKYQWKPPLVRASFHSCFPPSLLGHDFFTVFDLKHPRVLIWSMTIGYPQ